MISLTLIKSLLNTGRYLGGKGTLCMLLVQYACPYKEGINIKNHPVVISTSQGSEANADQSDCVACDPGFERDDSKSQVPYKSVNNSNSYTYTSLVHDSFLQCNVSVEIFDKLKDVC